MHTRLTTFPPLLAALAVVASIVPLRAQIALDPFISNNATCPVVLPGFYFLTNDVEWSSTNPAATAPIAIVGSGVILDLNGKTIRALGSSTNTNNGTGLFVDGGLGGISNVTVFNGAIEGFRNYGVFVQGVQGAVFADLTNRSIGLSNSPPSTIFPLPTGFLAAFSGNVTLSNVTVSNVSGWTNAQLVAGMGAMFCSNFVCTTSTITGVRGESYPNPDVANVNSALNSGSVYGFFSAGSVGTRCSNLTVRSISADLYYKEVAGIAIAASSSNTVISRSSVRGVTNEGGTVQGILGVLGIQDLTVANVQVSHIRTGQKWTNNAVAHTALGMAFAPEARPMRVSVLGATVTNGGRGYTSPPTVTIQTIPGDPGFGATARAVIAGGKVKGVEVISPGSNYIQAPAVKFSGGGGTNAGAIIMPSQARYYTSNNVGNIRVVDCVISNVIGGIDDAHGMSLFVVTNTVIQNVRVHHVRDGDNTLGLSASKATGIECYGNPMVDDSRILVANCHVDDIVADSPGDLAALGFSAAGGGITYIGCTASNVSVIGTNALNPKASPGRGYGFGWAPDIRIVFQYPAWNVTYDNCTATYCDVGFDTFNLQNSTWINPVSKKNRTAFLKQASRPGEPKGTKRVLYGAVWNELTDADQYPNGVKPIPVWNNAVGNWIERTVRRPF
ncbi:MAG: hypothetical protein ACKO39_11055 [Chthoniobacterales bacterium]